MNQAPEVSGTARWRCANCSRPLASAYAGIRSLRLADGPDEVHHGTIARLELAKHAITTES